MIASGMVIAVLFLWMRLLLLFCALLLPLKGPQNPPGDAETLLAQVRKKVIGSLSQLPRYLCTETVDRSTFQPEANTFIDSCQDLANLKKRSIWNIRQATSDRLRLDVAVSSHSEMYSWMGEDRFEDRSLAALVGHGTTVTGTFSSFLSAIFGTNAATITYIGDVSMNGRQLGQFGFQVPLAKSHYSIGSRAHSAVVEYGGTFLVDKTTFDLVHLSVSADRFPAEVDTCEATIAVDYGITRLNGSQFLLPKSSHLRVVTSDGSEFKNETAFSGCHEFLGQSTLRFDAPSGTAQDAVQKTVVKSFPITPGLRFKIALGQSIDTATAAAGDSVKADLTTAINEKHHRIVIPRGSEVNGRIVRIERRYYPASQTLLLAVQLETVMVNGVRQPFNARLESEDTTPKRRMKRNDALELREKLGSFDEMQELKPGILEFRGVTSDYVIKRGLELTGRTVAPK